MLAERMPARRLKVRLLGVGMSGLTGRETAQLSLFPEAEHERDSRLDEVTDRIKEKFGPASVQRGLGLLRGGEPKSDVGRANRDQNDE